MSAPAFETLGPLGIDPTIAGALVDFLAALLLLGLGYLLRRPVEAAKARVDQAQVALAREQADVAAGQELLNVIHGLKAQNESLQSALREAHAEVSLMHRKVNEQGRDLMVLDHRLGLWETWVADFLRSVSEACPNDEDCPVLARWPPPLRPPAPYGWERVGYQHDGSRQLPEDGPVTLPED